ncbi:hypothetical protein BGW36DRAFT_425699 [Talaromyces proteolyticus]|uniref:DUF7587 domain-containing protein n=1 Tax=Talaromyces proteolyticus TaxID=1131652 RepID=A0AAD4Q2Z7_9EURO|nr:uncharacterized protein BGW36DRAFT_425699 [Talaromyces proteolyticus]KAH8700896.1 hypothetical protein BGW36DRAFT_425699 [Talaromyces proteolyticus]
MGPPVSLNFREKRPHHSWTQEERFLLCCMRRFFDLHHGEVTKIFNEIYRIKISAEGFPPDGLKKSTLVIQWEDLGRKLHHDWRVVHEQVSFSEGPSRFSHLFEKIRESARRCHIGLVARARDLDVSRFQVKVERRRQLQKPAHPVQPPPPPSRSNLITIADEPTSIESQPIAPQLIQRPEENVKASQMSSTSVQIEPGVITDPIEHIRSYGLNRREEFPKPPKPDQMPSLLFRFSNDESAGINTRFGYIAYAFTENLANIPNPAERLEEFPAWVWTHVNKKRIPSPFISTSIDPLIPIHRALRANRNAIVSIVDPGQVNPDHVFYMRDLMRRYSIRTMGYYGTKEWIIWGSISRKAILTTFRIDELLALANQHQDIEAVLQLDKIAASKTVKTKLHDKLSEKRFENDFVVGTTIGKLVKLLRVRNEYVNDVALALNVSWSFASSRNTDEYLRGVESGHDATKMENVEAIAPSTNESSQSSDNNNSIEDYVMVEKSSPKNNTEKHEDPATEASRIVRESMDRLSIFDDADDNVMVITNTPTPSPSSGKGKEAVKIAEKRPALHQFSSESKVRKTSDETFSARNRTVATLHISMFNPESASWSPVHASPSPEVNHAPSVKEEIVPSIESIPSSAQVQRVPSAAPDVQNPRQSDAPVTPSKIKHSPHSSNASDSTLRNDTPGGDRFGDERTHTNRIMDYDWSAFWDSIGSSTFSE